MKTKEMAERLTAETEKIIIGKRETISLVLTAILAGGHVLLEDLPGSGKTTLVRTLALALGAAWSPASGFALSATARMVSSSLSEEVTGATFCADVSAMYNVEAFTVGLSAFNLGGKIRYGNSAYALPTLVKGGLRYAIETFEATAELDYLNGAGVMGGLGIEYWPVSILALRGGYHFGAADKGLPSFASLGLGLFVEGFGLDASVLLASPTLGGSFNIGVSYRF